LNSRTVLHSYFDRRSIRYPLARLIVAAVLIGIGLGLLSNAVLRLDSLRQDIQRNLSSAANAAGTAASAAVMFNDRKVALGVLRMFEAYPEVEAAALFTDTGVRLAVYGDEKQLPASVPISAPPPSQIALLADTATLQMPIEVDAAEVGSIYIQARLDAYWQSYFNSIASTFLIALIAGGFALVLAMRFLNRIIRPVRMLEEAANDARLHQDFTPREIPIADNEIGDLVRNFNALLSEVEAGRTLLHRQHEELERLVAERTAELLAAKDTADTANAAKTRFLAAASHDLRQPIHAMRLFIETLVSSPLNDEQRRIANYLTLSTRSLADILNALLDVSRLDGGQVRPHPEIVGADVLLRQIEAEFAPLALAKGLRFKFFFPANELRLFTDARLLYSLLRNIIDNAIKYTETGGVLVGFRRRGGHALIQVWDTGIGIAPNLLESVFDEYVQIGNPQRDRTQGLGLGLAIVKRLSGILGCRIRCHSRLNTGSRFEISVPLGIATALPVNPLAPLTGIDAVHAGLPVDDASGLARLQVVVIEDDEMAAKALEILLGANGIKVTRFGSAEHALADPFIEQADFYFVDFRLPGINGMEFLDALQKRVQRPIKATLLTGETYLESINSTPSPAWKVLLKPVESATLMAEIEAQMTQCPTYQTGSSA
jgi:signal transduction histidine kinase/ActR/RegA family two-component response regulator